MGTPHLCQGIIDWWGPFIINEQKDKRKRQKKISFLLMQRKRR
jgi:hypothetical protein